MKQPILYSILLVLFFCCVRTSGNSAAEYGVGFNLALDYGTASIWYANGTAVDVVKLEGGAAYKQVMRSVNAPTSLPTSSNEPTPGLLGYMSLQDYLPSWTASEPLYPGAEAITWMFKGLKAATEAYIEEPLTAISVSTPFRVRQGSPLDNTLRTTVESLGSKYKGTRTAPIAITGIYGLEGHCDPDVFKTPDQQESPDDLPQIYLALDYSRAGMLAFLIEEECGITQVLRADHNATLAAGIEFPGKHEDLSRTLKDMIRPVSKWYPGVENYKHPVEISELVMLGESTGDAMLHEVLLEVLGTNYTDLKAGSDKRATIHHPLFAGSRAIAISCQKQLEFESTHEWDEGFQGWLLKETPEEDQRRWWWPRKRNT